MRSQYIQYDASGRKAQHATGTPQVYKIINNVVSRNAAFVDLLSNLLDIIFPRFIPRRR